MSKPAPQTTPTMEGLEAAAPQDGWDEEPEVEEEVEEEEESDEEAEEPEGSQASDPPESDEGDEEVPTSYFGKDLSHIEDPEARKAVIEVLEEQNRVVNRRLQELAEAKKEQPTPASQPDPEPEAEEDDDAAIMAEMGVDVNHPYYEELKDFLLPIAKRTHQVESQLQATVAQQQASEGLRKFHTELDSLEEQFGELPYDRETVVDYALEAELYNPAALYWSVMGPLQSKAADEIAKRAATADTKVRTLKKQVSGTRPRSSAKGATAKVAKPKTLEEALAAAEEKLGKKADF